MAQALSFFLTYVENIGQFGDANDLIQNSFLSRITGKAAFQLGSPVEMVLQQALAPVGDNEDILNTSGRCFFYNILDSGLVHDGEHFLGHHFGGGQHSCAQASRGNHRFAYFFHNRSPPKRTFPAHRSQRGILSTSI